MSFWGSRVGVGRLSAVLLTVIALSLAPVANAQLIQGAVDGTVTDTTGAVIPGAGHGSI